MTTPNKLSQEVINLLLPRLQDEFDAAFFYRAASNWCENAGYKKAAKFFNQESHDELEHAKALEDFMTKWNVLPALPAIDKPFTEFKGLVDIVDQAYKIEYQLYEDYETTSNEILSKGDTCVFDFLGYFRQVQTDSVAEYSDLLNKLALIDEKNPFQLFYFENEVF